LTVPFDDVTKILKKAKVWDAKGNTSTWLSRKIGFTREEDDQLTLIQPGREQAQKALAEIVDPAVDDEWNPDHNGPAKRAGGKKA